MNGGQITAILIVLIVMGAIVLRSRYRSMRHDGPRDPRALMDDPEARRLREEVVALRERVQVLERIATDRNHLLEQEIDRLRDH